MAACSSSVRLLRDEVLGIGSYGVVCKATHNELPCAAKLIHQAFFPAKTESMDPGMARMLERFNKECELLSTMQHPCIVQYICHYVDQESGLPVLLMELMDESLTKFLANLTEPVPYHIQVSITHDILLALAFLHSKAIIHRDLSSNNVLLIGRSRAKVTDFGMSKLVEISQNPVQLTQCPGTQVYMAPESLRSTPIYTEKLDIFAAGVLMIQIITGKFPAPGVQKVTLEDEHYGMIEAPIAEQERRKNDIDLVAVNHPLRPVILNCIADREANRPSATDLCRAIADLKDSDKYERSFQLTQERLASIKRLEDQTKQQERELEEQKSEMERLCMAHKDEIDQLNAIVTAKDGELQALRRVISEKDRLVETLKKEKTEAAELHAREVQMVIKKKDSELQHQKELAYRHYQNQGTGSSSSTSSPASNTTSEVWLIADDPTLGLDLSAPPSDMWYHGCVDRVTACKRLEGPKTPGGYLIRESGSEKGAFVLSYLDRESCVHHFKIEQRSKRYNIGGANSFTTLHNLVGFHTRYSSVMEKFSERLEVPVPPPTPVSLPPNIH